MLYLQTEAEMIGCIITNQAQLCSRSPITSANHNCIETRKHEEFIGRAGAGSAAAQNQIDLFQTLDSKLLLTLASIH